MKKIFTLIISFICALAVNAQGWPDNYGGVMLQGFYWDSFNETKWTTLEKQAPELGNYFSLVWIPQSGYCGGGKSMGYNPLYYFNQNSSFGTEAELRSLIKTFKDNGIGTIADVVVNHRGNVSNWVDFPKETYNGETYEMLSTDICLNDDGGAAKKWADANGYSLSTRNDSGEDWSGMRDLDHYSDNVQRCVKAYLTYLLNNLGYCGFRYDMVKGFSPAFVGVYNNHARVQYSVGEHWGSASEAKTWINGTTMSGVKESAAFDFQFHYRLYDAVSKKNWAVLNANTDHLVKSGSEYNRYAITFVENHDTQWRSSSETGSCPISTNIVACNAYLLAMPGTPCVFLKHWITYKNEIKKMIEARKLVGVTNTSTYSNVAAASAYTAITVNGKDGRQLLAVIGTSPQAYTATGGFKKLTEGDGYIYYVSTNTDTSGWEAILQRIASEDVTEPEQPFTDRDVTIYVDSSLPTGWAAGSVNYWVWSDTDGTTLTTVKSWPGDKVTATVEKDGKKWFWKTFRVTKSNHPINIVLSTGSGSPQTVDFNDIETDKYLEVAADKVSGKNVITDVTSQHTSGITDITTDDTHADAFYTVSGQYAGSDISRLAKGLYVGKGKKYLKNK